MMKCGPDFRIMDITQTRERPRWSAAFTPRAAPIVGYGDSYFPKASSGARNRLLRSSDFVRTDFAANSR